MAFFWHKNETLSPHFRWRTEVRVALFQPTFLTDHRL
jgi:hypothetical protein